LLNTPVKRKLGEAKYFLMMMKKNYSDDRLFGYNLSAFLSAARSITFYLQTQYKKQDGFSNWYERKQQIMSSDLELEFFNKARVEAVHKRPSPYMLRRTQKISFDPSIEQIREREKKGLPHIPQKMIIGEPKTIKRFFPDLDEVDVIEFCETQLIKIEKIVKECENLFDN